MDAPKPGKNHTIAPYFESNFYHPEVEKLWGWEFWIVNDAAAGYCGKLLFILPGYQCSLHYHPIKTETFYCIEGTALIEAGGELFVLQRGDSLTIPPGCPHRFQSHGEKDDPCQLIEFSTPHSDDDVVRLEESRELPQCEAELED